jgi:hypothetical protein
MLWSNSALMAGGRLPRLAARRRPMASAGRALVVLALGLALATPGAGAAEGAAKLAALQACPTVEEEIVDLELLADGLKKSNAVGLMEKLRLRSAIDDLVARLEAYHAGARRYTQAHLQQQYDLLLMRIAAHLQHKDQLLHARLCNAWEAIWLDLIDSERFTGRSW